MSETSSNWCTIESDPGVFTSLIESFGVKNVELSELYSLDDDSLSNLVDEFGKVYGLVFLFKWDNSLGVDNKRKPMVGDEMPSDLFFAKQVTHNACATQAILSVLINAPHDESETQSNDDEKGNLVLGSMLSSLKNFTSSFPPELKGEAIGASEDIRNAHNSFARKEMFLVDGKSRFATDDDDVFHFIAYVPHKEHVYELDGLQPGPIQNGKFDSESEKSNDTDLNWLKVARSAIQERIEKYAASEIKFNLMAVVKDKRISIESKIDTFSSVMKDSGKCENNDLYNLELQLESEKEKRKLWGLENGRRTHNYLPFAMELITVLAEYGKLSELTKKATEKTAESKRKRI